MGIKSTGKYYAHSLEGQPPENWQPLEEHLQNVATMAGQFARPFGGEDWAYLAGLWHDLGKYALAFQAMLYRENGLDAHIEMQPGRVVHSEAGGHLASLKGWGGTDRVLSWLIMGHHAGLADFNPSDSGAKALKPKMAEPERSQPILDRVPALFKDAPPPDSPWPRGADPAFFLRMLFSCLVDADFLDTERFMDARRHATRDLERPSLANMLAAIELHMSGFEGCRGDVNAARAEVLAACRSHADDPPGPFSLTVPTGGGKTLASLVFALRHAVKHHRHRVIYVIPYTSIIEQTAAVFRGIPGFENAVLEHHSNLVEDGGDQSNRWRRLAAENWDAPLVVTTSVRFFESLYAARTSHCRRLHNIVDSVVIFDEAQCFPPAYLRPIVFAIRELIEHYGVSAVLCTATQPVLDHTDGFEFRFREGFPEGSVTEIVAAPDALAHRLKRVEVKTLAKLAPTTIEMLATKLCAEKGSALCIVNRKETARGLAALLSEESTRHLSTNMCAQHRLAVLNDIRECLLRREKIRVVSTSLVEAGVDLDFPAVYRELAGLDSIAQAAGRCNREGALTCGRVTVFCLPDPPKYVTQPAAITRALLDELPDTDLLLPSSFRRYFQQRFFLLGEDQLDGKGILKLLQTGGSMTFAFRSAAEKLRLIEDDWQRQVIVPYGDAAKLVDECLEHPWEQHRLLRQLQRLSIAIPATDLDNWRKEGLAHSVGGDLDLTMLDPSLYSEQFGYTADPQPQGFMAI